MDNKWDWTALRRKAAQWFQGKRASQLLVAAGLGGMLLIGLSQVMPPGREEPAPQPASQEAQPQDYARQLEQRLDSLVESIEGAGEARVMVTLEQTRLQVYATERKEDSLLEDDSNTGSARRSDSLEETYLLVEDAEGHSQALPTTTVEPKVRGVAVVCQGADDPLVATRVTEAVTTALGISSNRVCVVRLGDNTTEQSGGL